MDGKAIIAMGIPEGPHIGQFLKQARTMEAYGSTPEVIEAAIRTEWAGIEAEAEARRARQLPLRPVGLPYADYLVPDAANADEVRNAEAVHATMAELMRVPVVQAGAVMPDACPAGVIPVGGVVASTGIHPGFHSADVCCSMFLTVFGPGVEKADVMERFHAATHFGNGRREDPFEMPAPLRDLILSNPITAPLIARAEAQLGTQGDGNHHAFVGSLESNGATALVTHHGSRGFGAKIYKAGMEIAEKHRRELSPETPPEAAWIPGDHGDALTYWEALQIAKAWTYTNHAVLHNAVGMPHITRLWNPHNFVFIKDDNLFYHAKGATPTGFQWGKGATPVSIIPLNMAEPILLVEAGTATGAMGFGPHGAGRNYSRTEHLRRGVADLDAETAGLDIRFWCGKPDLSELPSAYKDAAVVQREIERFDLARIIDRILPYGSIMAGDHEADAPWRKRR